MRLRPEFEALRGSLLHRSPLPSITDAVCEFIAEETRLRLLSPTQSLAPMTSALAASHASPQTSPVRGPPKVNPKVTCFYCKKPGHVVSACRARERVHGPYVPRSTTSSSPLAASGSSLSADQLAQLSAYLTQTLGISAGSSTTDATALFAASGSASPWIFDSGATHHMTPDHSVISQPATPAAPSYIYTANGSRLPVSHTGNITPQSDPSGKLTLPMVLCVPNLSMRLISVSQLTDLNCYVNFGPFSCTVQDHSGRKIEAGRKEHGLYVLEYLHLPLSAFPAISLSATSELWHHRLGHLSDARLRTLSTSGVLGNISSISSNKCETCRFAKQIATSFSSSDHISNACFDLVHSDVWGPSPVSSISGYAYYICFIDDFSRYTWVYLMRHRSEVLQIYTDFTNMIFTQFQRRIKIFRSDGAKEFLSSSMQNLLKSHGTLHQQSCPHTHQQNGTAERKHRHLLDVTRALLLSANVPKTFWAEAVLTATLLINVTPSSAIGNVTSYSRMHTSPFDYSLLRTFGCTCFVLLPIHEKDKLSAKTSRCVFVGYSSAHKGYRCYDPVTRRLRIAKHVSFFENIPYYKKTSPSPNMSFLESSSSLPIPSYAPPSEIPTHIQPDPQTVATPPSPSISIQDSHATTPCSDTTTPSSPSDPAPPPPRRNPPRDRNPPA